MGFEVLWKQHRQDQHFSGHLAGLQRWFPDMLLWQWHGKSLGHQGHCDSFQEHIQEFSVSQNGDPLSSHTNLGTQPCISAAWAFRSPTAQLRVLFLPGSLRSSCYCFPLSLQNASWPQSRKSPFFSYFPDEISPKSISHPICIYHSAGFSFSTMESVLDLSPPCHLFWSLSYKIIS